MQMKLDNDSFMGTEKNSVHGQYKSENALHVPFFRKAKVIVFDLFLFTLPYLVGKVQDQQGLNLFTGHRA